jgi:DNA replication protein DnaC
MRVLMSEKTQQQDAPVDVCPHCGAQIQAIEVFGGRVIHKPCDCEKAREERGEQACETHEERKERALETTVCQRLEFGGIPSRFYAESPNEQLYQMLNEEGGLYLWGGVGAGKTRQAMRLATQWCIDNTAWYDDTPIAPSVRFVSSPALMAEIKSTFNQNSELTTDDVVAKYAGSGLLVIDDLGQERVTGWAVEQLYLIINKRYLSQKPLVVTSNYALNELGMRLASENGKTAEAIASRIEFMCKDVHTSNGDLRSSPREEDLCGFWRAKRRT